ncbi:hypothetical protein [Psychromonas sp. Urea-02u-13]|nr:hypothetical protein [Psychromonas sp. Urea-02u-13]
MNKKQKNKLKKSASKSERNLFLPQAEFSNSSPMRGTAYAKNGVNYGW